MIVDDTSVVNSPMWFSCRLIFIALIHVAFSRFVATCKLFFLFIDKNFTE